MVIMLRREIFGSCLHGAKAIVSFLSVYLIIDIYGLAKFGEISAVLALVALVGESSSLKYELSLVEISNDFRRKSFGLLTFILAVVIAFFLSILLSEISGRVGLLTFFLLSLCLLIQAFLMQESLALDEPYGYSLMATFPAFMFFSIFVMEKKLNLGIGVYDVYFLGSLFVLVVFVFLAAARYGSEFQWQGAMSCSLLKKFSHYPRFVFPAAASNVVANQSVYVLLPIFLAPENAGAAALAFKLIWIPVSVVGAGFMPVMRVNFMLVQGSKVEYRRVYREYFLLLFSVALLAVAVLLVFVLAGGLTYIGGEWSEAGGWVIGLLPALASLLVVIPLSIVTNLRGTKKNNLLWYVSFGSLSLVVLCVAGNWYAGWLVEIYSGFMVVLGLLSHIWFYRMHGHV